MNLLYSRLPARLPIYVNVAVSCPVRLPNHSARPSLIDTNPQTPAFSCCVVSAAEETHASRKPHEVQQLGWLQLQGMRHTICSLCRLTTNVVLSYWLTWHTVLCSLLLCSTLQRCTT
jgi:hypothetical protein